MLPQLCFFASIAFGFIAWGIVAKRYIWPKLRLLRRAEALRPLLVLHSFRFIGLAFLVAWIFNLWGSADLLNAFYRANDAGLMAGQLGATYFIPTLIVPLLLITHRLAFRILLQRQSEGAGDN
jgi:hypothetical protein